MISGRDIILAYVSINEEIPVKDFDTWYNEYINALLPGDHDAHKTQRVLMMKEHMRRGWRECADFKDKVITGLKGEIAALEASVEEEKKSKEALALEIHFLTTKLKALEKNVKKK